MPATSNSILFISDNFYPETLGGAELVDSVLIENIKCDTIKTDKFNSLPSYKTYIVSNISKLSNSVREELLTKNYVILEHDYKIVEHRNTWIYPNRIVPIELRTNYDLYKNAKAVFCQTQDHINGFLENKVTANFINLQSSLWSIKELDFLSYLYTNYNSSKKEFMIVKSDNPIKNTEGAINFCKFNNLDYVLIEGKSREQFLTDLASSGSTLVFFPLARESFCRLVVEARCVGANVITTKNYGAVLEPWFSLKGNKLIELLRKNTESNIKTIKSYL